MEFGERLKELRKKKRMTQEELGKVINVSKVSISGYETGSRSPDRETLVSLADFFDVSVDFLLGREESGINNKPLTIAAHIDDDVTDEEMEDILNYIEFIKNKHRK